MVIGVVVGGGSSGSGGSGRGSDAGLMRMGRWFSKLVDQA